MILSLTLKNKTFRFDTAQVQDISIPLRFNGRQPNLFGVKHATSIPFKGGEIIGDTRQGGSCNFEEVNIIPHCNGTHTECIGHVTHQRFSICRQLTGALIPSSLISVLPEACDRSNETYDPSFDKDDKIISRKSLVPLLSSVSPLFLKGLIVRSLPHDAAKLSREYTVDKPPFFTNEAMSYLCELGVKHLLVDLPSVDRINDEGKLSNHRIFWKMDPESFEISPESHVNNTITEMIFVPPEVEDGCFALNLQIASFEADASPSRPLLYPLI